MKLTLAQIQAARALITGTYQSLRTISAKTGVSYRNLRSLAKNENLQRPDGILVCQPDHSHTSEAFDRRLHLLRRLWKAAENQMSDIEANLQACQAGDPLAREKETRLMGTLVKTLRDLAALDNALHHKTDKAEEDTNDSFPRDPEALRAELASRLERLRQQRNTGELSENPATARGAKPAL